MIVRLSLRDQHPETKKTLEGHGDPLHSFLPTVVGLVRAGSLPAAAEVTRLEITSKTSYGSFLPGDYVLWRGKVHGELVPTETISDPGKAKRGADLPSFNGPDGKLRYIEDVAGLLPILTSSTSPQSSGDAAPSFAAPEFRGVNEGPFTIGKIIATVEKRGETLPEPTPVRAVGRKR